MFSLWNWKLISQQLEFGSVTDLSCRAEGDERKYQHNVTKSPPNPIQSQTVNNSLSKKLKVRWINLFQTIQAFVYQNIYLSDEDRSCREYGDYLEYHVWALESGGCHCSLWTGLGRGWCQPGQSPARALSHSPLCTCLSLATTHNRVFRKGVKAKYINGHPPKPSGQSYYWSPNS